MVGLHDTSLECDDCFISEEAVRVHIDKNYIYVGSLGLPPSLPEKRGRKLLQVQYKI
jgi:hypothetical protein